MIMIITANAWIQTLSKYVFLLLSLAPSVHIQRRVIDKKNQIALYFQHGNNYYYPKVDGNRLTVSINVYVIYSCILSYYFHPVTFIMSNRSSKTSKRLAKVGGSYQRVGEIAAFIWWISPANLSGMEIVLCRIHVLLRSSDFLVVKSYDTVQVLWILWSSNFLVMK